MVAAAERLRASVPSDAVVVPGHGRPFGRDTLELYARLVRETADRVRDRIARGWSLARVVEEGVGERWRSWEAAVPESLFLASAYRAYGPEDGSAPPPPVRFEGGRWWDGTRFREGTWYAVGGRLTRSAPVEPDSVVELDGGYVLPGFGEAHTHRLGDPDRLAEDHEALLEAGVYYAMVQDPAHEVSDRMRALAASTEGVDAVYTQGVITPSRGVIPIFYRMMAEARGTEEDGEGRLYFTVDDAAELDAKWPAIEAQNDAFVKVILAFSEEHALRSADRERYDARPPRYSALPGLDPALLPDLVRRARGAGLRVSAHVETAADVRVAADAGVDVIAHLPASWQIGPETGIPEAERGRWLLSETDARAVARSGAVVVTTALPPPGREAEAAFAEVHRHNLAALRGAGARLAIGSDAFRGTVLDEVAYLEGLGVFERAELLRLLTRDTPRMIFPGRRLGALEEGAEADFVVLEADPTTDLSALREVRLRVKDGRVLATRTDEPSADRDTIPTTGAAVPQLAAFDRAVRSLMSVHGLPGASLAVARDERLVLARAYGHADTVGRERMRPSHRFRIASVSKPVTAAAVLKLVEDGELRLGDRAFAFLDQLEPPAGATVDPRFREITIRQLLRHRAGFDRTRGLDPTLTPGRVAAELGVGLPVEVEQVISFMLGRPLDFDPGTKTVYSNVGYAVLGRVIERVTGRDYEAYVREAILRPACATGMELGQAFPTDRPADEVSYYHPPPPGLVPATPPGEGQVPLPDGGFDLSVMDAHGGWIASAPDLLRFVTAIDGSPRRPDVLSPATVRRMTAPPSGEPVDTAYYAMGWDVRPAADGRPEAWWHAGDLPGTTALLMRSGRTAWALLLNGTAWGPEAHAEIRGALEAAARRVEAWPEHDLFGEEEPTFELALRGRRQEELKDDRSVEDDQRASRSARTASAGVSVVETGVRADRRSRISSGVVRSTARRTISSR